MYNGLPFLLSKTGIISIIFPLHSHSGTFKTLVSGTLDYTRLCFNNAGETL